MPPNPTILPERRCSTRPRGAGRPTVLGSRRFNTPQGRKSPARSGCAGRGGGRRHELRHHGATLWAWGARNGHGGARRRHNATPQARGAYWPHLRKRRPPARRPPQRHRAHAVGSASSATTIRQPLQAPDASSRARAAACYAFLQIGQLRGINPHQHQQEESYVPDFQFH